MVRSRSMRIILGASPLAAALAWIVALIADSGSLSQAETLLIGVGLVSTAAVSVVGMVIVGGRWAHRLAVVSVVFTLVVAAIRPIDVFWMWGLALSAAAASALFLPQVTSTIRKLPAAAGPPRGAVLAPLALVATPFLLGVSLGDGQAWAGLVVGLSATLVAFLFSRVVPGGLLALRVLWPLLAVALAPFLGIPAGLVSALAAVLVATLGWRADVKASFHPPHETGSAHRIPPELTPKEILDAAQIDERGKPR